MSGELRIGSILGGHYKLVRRLGGGSTGVVWLAETPHGTPVACKVFHDDWGRSRIHQLVRQAEALAQLCHRNVARPLQVSTEGHVRFLVMDYVAGRPLHHVMGSQVRSGHHFPGRQVRAIFNQLCDGVISAHDMCVLHRDIKPQHVMVDDSEPEPEVKLLDFGHAHLPGANFFDATTIGRRLGSLHYRAPEQTLGHPATIKSDMFAISTILFELITLHRAWVRDVNDKALLAFPCSALFDEAVGIATLRRIAFGPRPRAQPLRLHLSPTVDRFFEMSLAIDPAERPSTVAELRAAAAPIIDEIPDQPSPLEASDPVLARRLFEIEEASVELTGADWASPDFPSMHSLSESSAIEISDDRIVVFVPEPSAHLEDFGTTALEESPTALDKQYPTTPDQDSIAESHSNEPELVSKPTGHPAPSSRGLLPPKNTPSPSDVAREPASQTRFDRPVSLREVLDTKFTMPPPARRTFIPDEAHSEPQQASPTKLLDPLTSGSVPIPSEIHIAAAPPPRSSLLEQRLFGRVSIRDLLWALTAATVGWFGMQLGASIRSGLAPESQVERIKVLPDTKNKSPARTENRLDLSKLKWPDDQQIPSRTQR